MQLAMVIGLVALILIASAVTVVAQDRRIRQQDAKRRKARLARLGEPTPRLMPITQARRQWGSKTR